MRRPRIALVTTEFPNPAEPFTARRVIALAQRGWDIHVVCERSTDDGARFLETLPGAGSLSERIHVSHGARTRPRLARGLLLHGVPLALRRPAGVARYLRGGRRTHGHRVFARFLEDVTLLRLRPDVVHYEFGVLPVGRETIGEQLDAALVVSFQGFDLNYMGLDREPGFYAELWRRVTCAHFVSRDLEARAHRRGMPPDVASFVVPGGIDPDEFDPDEYDPGGRRHTDVAGTDARPCRIVGIGRLHWKKGYEYALESLKLLVDRGKRVEYRIVGDGDHLEAVRYAIEDLGLHERVTLVGALPTRGVRDQLAWADMLVHAATSEGFCLAVTEAQAMGIPVVATDADGLRENVADGETGYIVPRRDVVRMADKIAELAADPDLREAMGRAGMKRAREHFTLTHYVDGMEAIYRFAVGRRETRR